MQIGLDQSFAFPIERTSPTVWGRQGGVQDGNVVTPDRYYVTDLHRSNVRTNDDLNPDPTKINYGDVPRAPWPHEHAYSSHIERSQMFPHTAPAQPDPATRFPYNNSGLAPTYPNGASMPEGIRKIRGNAYRDETSRGELADTRSGRHSAMGRITTEPLQWRSEVRYQPGAPGGAAQPPAYPTPPSYANPNQDFRYGEDYLQPGERQESENREQSNWLSMYRTQFTGQGNATPLKFDQPQLIVENTQRFSPAQPREGRTARKLMDLQNRPCIQGCDDHHHHWHCPNHMRNLKTPAEVCAEHELDAYRSRIQEMEARNRYQELNLMTPADNMMTWRQQQNWQQHAAQPSTFQFHFGNYVNQRAGLYKPDTYSAEEFRRQWDRQAAPSFHHGASHVDALSLPTSTNQVMNSAPNQVSAGSAAIPAGTPLKDQWDYLQPLYANKNANHKHFQQGCCTGQIVQDGRRIQIDTEYGNRYNVPLVQQTRAVTAGQRANDSVLMSSQNQNIENVKAAAEVRVLDNWHPLHRSRTEPDLRQCGFGYSSGPPIEHLNIAEQQNSYSHSDARREFHEKCPNEAPDLRHAMIEKGKKHYNFWGGYTSQTLRGNSASAVGRS